MRHFPKQTDVDYLKYNGIQNKWTLFYYYYKLIAYICMHELTFDTFFNKYMLKKMSCAGTYLQNFEKKIFF